MPRRRPPPDLHPDCALLLPLLGSWSGHGEGSYPGIADFAFDEEVAFESNGARYLIYRQRTSNPDTGAGMHVESGFWRPVLPDRVEVVIAHPTGVGEIYEGTVDEGLVELRSTTIAHTTTAKRVDIMERTFRIHGDVMHYTVRMAAMGRPLTHHLRAELHRVG